MSRIDIRAIAAAAQTLQLMPTQEDQTYTRARQFCSLVAEPVALHIVENDGLEAGDAMAINLLSICLNHQRELRQAGHWAFDQSVYDRLTVALRAELQTFELRHLQGRFGTPGHAAS